MPLTIGAVGWATRTGIGYEIREMWDLGFIQRWLIPEHPQLGIEDLMAPSEGIRCRISGDDKIYRKFLDGLDVVIIVEQPLIEGLDLVAEARRRGCLVVCMPHMEWFPRPQDTHWVRQVQMMWGPTRLSLLLLQEGADRSRSLGRRCEWEKRIHGGRWGVNIARFQFRERQICRRFLFANGYGGHENRKGIGVVLQAAELAPEVNILIHSQESIPPAPSNCEVLVQNYENRQDLYQVGDIFLAPSRWEGIGLSLYEAQACGMPVLATDGPPMNECLPLEVIRCKTATAVLDHRAVRSCEASPIHLAELMRQYHGQEISQSSRNARLNMETHFSLVDSFRLWREAIENVLQG